MSDSQALTPAATVILLKAAEPHGFEVLLTRRSAANSCGTTVYGFPAVPMRDEDCSDRALACSRGLTANGARAIVGAHVAPRKALGLWLAAIRVLFEEVGILLAAETAFLDSSRIRQMHAELLAKTVSFQKLLENNHLVCDTARLGYFSHWQTPTDAAPTLDSHFFVAALPENQSPLTGSDAMWLTPDHALQLAGKSELPMAFPTFAALRTLADFDSLDRVLREFQPRSRG